MAPAENKWDVKEMKSSDKEWSARTGPEKALFVTIQFLKVVCAFGLLYLFLLSLSMMGNAFKILGGPTAGKVFRETSIFGNPFAGCSLGILATVLVQSSSTSTSIIISMTAAGLMEPENAMYMIMGANIGTSVTNTIVSVTQIGDTDEYRRAFAGATVHDCFNFLTVSILLPLEYFFHVLYAIGNALVESAGIEEDQDKEDKIDFIKKITKPVTSRLISVDKKLVTKVAEAEDDEKLEKLLKSSMIKNSRTLDNNLFLDTPLTDSGAGWLLLFVSLAMLSTTLILLVKLLQTIFRGRAAIWMQGMLNLEFKSVPCVADYILIVFGVGLTILMQSSSVTTSTLTPLVGIGLIKLEKMFPFTVGANIGTTVTGILSALAGSNIATGMTVALGHLFFNLIGTLIWFPLPFMRAVPLAMAKGLGSLAADLKWFPIAYILFMFVALPGFLFLLSLAHWALLVFVGLPFLLALGGICCVFAARANKPELLPESLKRDASWMPPSLKMEREGVEADADGAGGAGGEALGNADGASAHQWWLAPVAYGLGWYVIFMLLLAVPNAKWADLKYVSFDEREHIGLGGWSACSAMFEEDVPWALTPFAGAELSTLLDECTNDLRQECQDDAAFSEKLGANSVYEESWRSCARSTTEDWEAKCKALTGCGDLHEDQCSNVSTAVTRLYSKDYSATGSKWVAQSESDWNGFNYCIALDALCPDIGGLGAASGLGVASIVFGFAGLFLMIAYSLMGESRDMSRALWGSAALLALTWILLLAAWASVAGALGQEATCYIQDDQNDGIVAAKGKLGEITNGGSYSYGLVMCAWLLLTPVIALVAHRIFSDRKRSSSPGPTSSRAETGDA